MVVEAGAKFYGDIGGFAVGDTIDVTNLAPPGSSYFDPNNTFTLSTPEGALTFTGSTDETFLFDTDGSGGTYVTIACFRRGTRILTERGEVAIESLRIGDQVTTLPGAARPIRWIGRRSYSGDVVWGDRALLPILIRQGAIAKNVPTRDLWVSPEHAMYIDGILIPAALLVNGRVDRAGGVGGGADLLPSGVREHEVIMAEGAFRRALSMTRAGSCSTMHPSTTSCIPSQLRNRRASAHRVLKTATSWRPCGSAWRRGLKRGATQVALNRLCIGIG